MERTLNIIKHDLWLEPFEEAINGRYRYALGKKSELTNGGKQSLSDFATGYLYFGLHKTSKGWVFREWAPNATQIYLIGTFSNWKEDQAYAMTRFPNGS